MYAQMVAAIVRLMIRLNPDLHAWLTELAQREHRTLNGQLTHILEHYRASQS